MSAVANSKPKVDKGALLPISEEENLWARVTGFYLIPEGPFMANWDRLMVLIALLNAILLPFMASFRQLSPGAFAVCYIIDAFCFADMYFKFHIAYLAGGFWVVFPKDMATNYMATTEFKLDLITNMQFDLIALAWGVGSQQSLYRLALIRLPKLFRSAKILTYFHRQEKKLHASLLLQLLKFLSLLMTLIHSFGCVWFAIACPYGTAESCNDPSWVVTEELIQPTFGNSTAFVKNVPQIYGFTVYWAITTLTTTGYGDIRPENDGERLFALLTMTCGTFFFGYVSGTIASSLSNMDSRRVSYQQKMDAVQQYMNDRNMEEDMQERVLDYYDYVWERNKGIDVRNLFEDMPSTFKGEVALSLNNAIIDKATIFRKCSNGFRRLLAIHMKLYLFTANEYVIHKGDLGVEMFFITQGRIDVYATEDMKRPTSSLIEGAYFGEFQIILHHRHEYSARVVCNTDIYVLQKEDLDFAFSCYPEDKDLVKQATEDRYKQAQSQKKGRKAKDDLEDDDSNGSLENIVNTPAPKLESKRRGSMNPAGILKSLSEMGGGGKSFSVENPMPQNDVHSPTSSARPMSMIQGLFYKDRRQSHIDPEKGRSSMVVRDIPQVPSHILSNHSHSSQSSIVGHESKSIPPAKLEITASRKGSIAAASIKLTATSGILRKKSRSNIFLANEKEDAPPLDSKAQEILEMNQERIFSSASIQNPLLEKKDDQANPITVSKPETTENSAPFSTEILPVYELVSMEAIPRDKEIDKNESVSVSKGKKPGETGHPLENVATYEREPTLKTPEATKKPFANATIESSPPVIDLQIESNHQQINSSANSDES
ncbi:Kinesin-like protein kif27 [Physocladia obscura]|uniref:Kinesin-like protein kif27 n=1 Tax=Physocladia obscura TaxID=109957 RepID=A0AAD5T3N2_9FUNG|nr:Kinesin-like protein kif27 [Physocladia obscura]